MESVSLRRNKSVQCLWQEPALLDKRKGAAVQHSGLDLLWSCSQPGPAELLQKALLTAALLQARPFPDAVQHCLPTKLLRFKPSQTLSVLCDYPDFPGPAC